MAPMPAPAPRLRLLPPVTTTLEKELGTAGVLSLGGWLETFEEAPELRWPNDVIVYDRMRRSDAQVASTLRACNLPIRRTRWSVVGDNVRPEVRRFVEVELGLTPERDGRRRRRRQGIVWDDFLTHALLMLPLGHMAFEQVYLVDEAGPELEDVASVFPAGAGQVIHLRKLAPRLPRTITRWELAADGGVDAIHQQVYRPDGTSTDVAIPIDRLVLYVNDREGSDWTGTSVLRSAYKHWLIKDTLIRLGPLTVERNGMGLPTVTYPAGGDEVTALAIATKARAGEEAGVALPDGYILRFEGVSGTLKDELPLLKYHDEAIGRNVLAMILDLGHDAGARALGTVFADLFANSLNAIVANIEETTTEHVIRDLVELNFGPDEAYPELAAEEIAADAALSPEALQQLVDAGVVLPDRDLEGWARSRYGLPDLPDPEEFGEPTDDPHGRNTPGQIPEGGPPATPPGPTTTPAINPPGYSPQGAPGMPADAPATAASAARLEARLAAAHDRVRRRRAALEQ
jgi:hypothetical protein